MKFLAALLLLFSTVTLSAQPSFEGKITYRVTTYEKSENGIMTIYFGKPGIRLELHEEKIPEQVQQYIIINFDSGLVYSYRPGNTYGSSPLKRKAQNALQAEKDIAGFKTTAVSLATPGMPRNLMGLFESSTLYAANDLSYTIPNAYSAAPELLMIYMDKIVLGGDFFTPNYSSNEWPVDRTKDSAANQIVLSVLATEVVRQAVDPGLFLVPAGYTKETVNYFTDSTITDTVVTYSDTTATVYPANPSLKKNKKPSKKASTISKQTATRSKND
jgi:hypothetical protein